MSSEVKANKISPATGTAVALGDSGDTFTVPSGATLANAGTLNIPSGGNLTIASGGTITNSGTATGFGSDNTPAFQAYLGSDQAISHDSTVKVTFDTEDFDTDSAYDNTTNYRFTVPAGEGGKYFCYATMQVEGPAQGTYNFGYGDIYKNGSIYFGSKWNERNNPSEVAWMTNYGIIDLSVGDYIECFAYMTTTTSGAGLIKNYGRWTRFGAYKMIGL